MKILITGTICSGKTALAKSLQQDGFSVVHEQARRLIDEEKQKRSDFFPWTQPIDFQHKLLKRHLQSEIFWQQTEEMAFFDTGFLDGLTFLRAAGHTQEFSKYTEAAKVLHYDYVFLLEQLPEDCDSSTEWSKDFAKTLHEAKLQVYEKEFAYKVILVPVMELAKRKQFILDIIKGKKIPLEISH